MRRIFAMMTVSMAMIICLVGAPSAAAADGVANGGSQCDIAHGGVTVNGFVRPFFHTDCPAHIGWGSLAPYSLTSCVWRGCGPQEAASATVEGFYWNGRAWVRSDLMTNESVYVYPFASGWSWTYYRSHWYAVRSERVMVGRHNTATI